MAAVASENYQLKWHSFGAHLHTSVATSLNSDAFTDVSLFTIDGYQVNAHRFVLSACSQYLQRIFKHQQKITSSLPILVVMPPEINYKTLKTLIQYMYCGETTVSNDILENVLRGGDILQVRGLWRPPKDRIDPPPPSSQKTPVIVLPKNNKNILRTVDSNKPSEPSDKKNLKPNEKAKNDTTDPLRSTTSPNTSDNNSTKTTDNDNSDDKIESQINSKNNPTEKDENNVFVIKQEPMDWNEYSDDIIEEPEMFHTEMTIKPEIIFPSEDEEAPEENEDIYSPLTCELCSEVFQLPADWVKHIRTHTDNQPAKRQRRGRPSVDEDDSFPPLQCDLCQQQFPTPGEWVRHIQNTHTDKELAQSNNSPVSRTSRVTRPVGFAHKICTICNKKFPSHASMIIHKRTHTGEKPFVCEYCQKGFNVKSNLLRHLRTLHDKIIASTEIGDSA